jgi:Arc/MetJ-type ribon-helix-helix transcriptional regulator
MGTTERLVLDLPSEIVAVLREAVQRGDFHSESEALSAIVRAFGGDIDFEEDIEEIRAGIAEGMAEADADEVISANEVHAELRAKIKAIADQRG